MQFSKNPGSRTVAQCSIALALLVTFSTGIIAGRQLAKEAMNSPADLQARITGPHFPYDLGQPVRRLNLPVLLREVSAISYVDGSRVGMVQDEQGIIFISSLTDGHIIREISFASNGDYEGLAIVNDQAWVLRSDGDLYHVSALSQTSPVIGKVETFLKHSDDTEGLTYDAIGRQLLVGLKQPPKLDGKRQITKRAVFAYQPQGNFMSASPFLLLDMDELKRVYSNQVSGDKPRKFNPKNKQDFLPSDLAIHPITGHIYHIAARGQLLVVSDRSGQIYFVRDLPKDMFRQPEGISFDPHGNMFIVNEGAGSNGIMLEFRYQPTARKIEPTESTSGFSLL